MKIKNTHHSKLWVFALFSFAAIMRNLPGLRQYVIDAGNHAEYMSWVSQNFYETKLFRNREALWTMIIQNLSQADRAHSLSHLRVFELGVAYGYTTNWFSKKLKGDFMIYGFDRFTGLPRKWREFDKGAFDAKGLTPDIPSGKVKFFVGDVEQTLQSLDPRELEYRKLIIFDLDLYEPSKFAFDFFYPHLKKGDIIYFDESFDQDERRIIDEQILNPEGNLNAKAFKIIGVTSGGCAFEVV
jgi:hypothetical protein